MNTAPPASSRHTAITDRQPARPSASSGSRAVSASAKARTNSAIVVSLKALWAMNEAVR